MCVLVRVVLLVLLVLSSNAAPAPEECNMPEKVKGADIHKLKEANWVLVEAFTDYPAGVMLLSGANSSLVEMSLNNDNKTFLFVERNIVNEKCLTFYVNMSVPDPEASNLTLQLLGPGVQDFDGKVSPYNDEGKLNAYQSCPHCLLIIYSGVFEGTPGRMLLIYRQEGKHLDTEELTAAQSVHREIAECLKFMVPSHFKYDGKAEFCLEKKDEEKDA
ncbi:saxitoxin and tetrodotoxin-binding protein 1-like [Tautogolabrus adspersus]